MAKCQQKCMDKNSNTFVVPYKDIHQIYTNYMIVIIFIREISVQLLILSLMFHNGCSRLTIKKVSAKML